MICSSPLTLGYDLTDDNITERIWDIIANKEAIAINQAWAGHPGKLLRNLTSGQASWPAEKGPNGCGGYSCDTQLWVKPLSETNGSMAVFLMSNSEPWQAGAGFNISNKTYTIELSWLGIEKGGATASIQGIYRRL